MATPNLIQLSQDLAYKLQDPAGSGTLPGERWTADGRLGYITRAYRRFYRILTQLYPELTFMVFKSNYKVRSTDTTDTSGTFDVSAYEEIYEVFCKMPTDEEWNRATYITPKDYVSTFTGYSDFYTPDYNSSTFYWSVISNNISILPQIQYSIFYSYREDDSSDFVYNTGTDLVMDPTFWDILLSLAAAEAYMDIGQMDMVNMYKADVSEQLQVLAVDKQQKEKTDEMD